MIMVAQKYGDNFAEEFFIRRQVTMDNRVKKLLGAIIKQLREVEPTVLYYTIKILKLNSRADIIDVADIKKGRRKDTIFIMGSGYSINDITKEEWQHIVDVGDTLSFNNFFRGRFVPITYHISGEISGAPNYGLILLNSKHRRSIKAYYDEIFSNQYYKNALYFLRYKRDYMKAAGSTALWALFFLKAFKNKQVCPYRIVTLKDAILEPSDNIYSITHCGATLSDAINISYILGYKKIVLVGVDLYDRRYFWLGRNESRDTVLKSGKTYSNAHDTADNMIKVMDIWNKYLIKKGVRLYIYNPRSLLNKVLPVYCSNANNEREGLRDDKRKD
jgi:hypothetical protein